MWRSTHAIAVAISSIFITVINGQQHVDSSRCGCLERPVNGPPRPEFFCRPRYTPPSILHKLRQCVCRPGLVRNSWGDCITKKECKECKCFWYKDYNVCGRECPLICGEPIRTTCKKDCAFGCDCPPGLIRTRSKTYCVKISECPPKCPQNSRYQPCLSTCAPKCGQRHPGNCVKICRRGGCVCNEGYAEAEQDGLMICVPQQECSKYAPMTMPFPPTGTGTVVGSGGSFGTSELLSGGTHPSRPVPRPGAANPPPGAEGSFPHGGPSRDTTVHDTGDGRLFANPPGTTPQGTPQYPQDGYVSRPQGRPSGVTTVQGSGVSIEFPRSPQGTSHGTPYETGGASPFHRNSKLQTTPQYHPPNNEGHTDGSYTYNTGHSTVGSRGGSAYSPDNAVGTTVIVTTGSSGYSSGAPCIVQGVPCSTFTYSASNRQPCRQC